MNKQYSMYVGGLVVAVVAAVFLWSQLSGSPAEPVPTTAAEPAAPLPPTPADNDGEAEI